MADTAEVNDAFGTAVASGDFNCDAYADLAIGAPGGNESNAAADIGAVHVVFGGPGPLSGAGSQFIQYHVNQEVEAGIWYFGSFLAAGNVNGDESVDNGCDDLVVGIPGHDIPSSKGTQVAAGSVTLLYGSVRGLDNMNLENRHQGSHGIPDDSETNDEFWPRSVDSR